MEVRITLPEDYVATSMAPPDDYATGAIPKCPACERLGSEVIEDMEITELEQGNIANEAYQAQQAHNKELFTWMRHKEEDLKAQEQRRWKEETRQWELRKKKKEEEEARKWATFQKTEEYERQKKRTEKSKDDMERRSITTNPFLEGFSKVPPKPKEMPVACKPSHRSEGKSSGQFDQPHCHLVINSLLDMRRFQYDHLHKRAGAMIAWAKMSIDLNELTREVNSLKYFWQPAEKMREVLEIVKYCLILGIDGYHNPIAEWRSWLTDKSHPIPDYAPFPEKTEFAKDIHMKAQQHWEYYLS